MNIYQKSNLLKTRFNEFKKLFSNIIPSNFQIIQFTPSTTKNPYFTMVGDELIKNGVDFKYIDDFQKNQTNYRKKTYINPLPSIKSFLPC